MKEQNFTSNEIPHYSSDKPLLNNTNNSIQDTEETKRTHADKLRFKSIEEEEGLEMMHEGLCMCKRQNQEVNQEVEKKYADQLPFRSLTQEDVNKMQKGDECLQKQHQKIQEEINQAQDL